MTKLATNALRGTATSETLDLADLKLPEAEEVSIHLAKVTDLIFFSDTDIWNYREDLNATRVKKSEAYGDCDPHVRDRYFTTEYNGTTLYVTFRPDIFWRDAPSDLRFPPGTDLSTVPGRNPESDKDYAIFLSDQGLETKGELVAQDAEARDLFWKLYTRILRDSPSKINNVHRLG